MENDAMKEVLREVLAVAAQMAAAVDIQNALMRHLREAHPALCERLASTLQSALIRSDVELTDAFVQQASDAIGALTGTGQMPAARSISWPVHRPSDPTKARAAFRLIPGGRSAD